ncbi:LamG domain-containing protein [Micromonospora sp. NBS 11-29]|uniref:LamG domain-containing protein n=1 Tax=Micromonospora sp. NBS 11-29 TaxID=1960879 RepID=UPI001594217B|nr:LamG domain-containing protein [Micromonospora sp. NBS 11-29]
MARDAAAASRLAGQTGQRVEVAAGRSELTQVFALPDGGFEQESAVVPQRARRADGSWAPVDLSLARGGDGLWRPVVSVADVRFSAGGSGPMVTLVRQGKSFSLSWQGGALPAPTIVEDSATYPGVLPDVDLVVRATWTGFSHVLVVKTPQAAANPALRQVRFNVGGDAQATHGADGELRAVAGGEVLAESTAATMWDSTPSSASRPQAAGRVAAAAPEAGQESSPVGPGDAAVTAPVRTEVTSGGDVVLHPDEALLTGSEAVFPVFIDPPWSTGKSRWAYATDNNSTNSDVSVARVGKNPDSGVLYRSFFDFPLPRVAKKHIEKAYVQATVDHTWSCDDTINYLWHAGPISSTPRTKWSPAMKTPVENAYSHANEAGGCSSIQPDMTVNFESSAITNLIQDHADHSAPYITMALCACAAGGSGESTQERWKKYLPNSVKLIVDYSSYPGQPYGLQTTGAACTSGVRSVIGTLTPTLSAVFPDADGDQALTTKWEWLEIPMSGTYNDSTPRKPAPAGASVPAGGRSTTAALSGLVNGKSYAFRAMATDPAPYSLTSAWSAWCEFKTDVSYPDVTATVTTMPAGPGEKGVFTLSSNTSTVVKFRYGWTFPPTTEITATGTGIRTATVTLTTLKYGENILYVSAINSAQTEGQGSVAFIVNRPAPPTNWWQLETRPGVTQTQALTDERTEATITTPLAPTGVTWSPGLRLPGAASPTFNGSSSALNHSQAVVNTTESFSVAAWVRLSALPTGEDFVAVSQDGTSAAGFQLGARIEGASPAPRWAFVMKDTADQASTTRSAASLTALTSADLGRWTHIAGVYDRPTGKMQLYVNGTLADTADRAAAPWPATGVFSIGRGFNGGPKKWFAGAIADVQAYDRVLVPQDFTGGLATDAYPFNEPGMMSAPLTSAWSFKDALPCYEASSDPSSSVCRVKETGNFKRRMALTAGSGIGYGQRNNALLLDGTHFVEEPTDPHYNQVTQEYGRSQNNLGDDITANWSDGAVVRTDASFTVSAWARVDAATGRQTILSQDHSSGYSGFDLQFRDTSGGEWAFTVRAGATNTTAITTAAATAVDPTEWHQLTGVLDAERRQIRLYVDGELKATTTMVSAWQRWNATGPFVVGRSDQPAGFTDWLTGGVDDILAYQGALTDGGVRDLYDTQNNQTGEE